MGRLSSYVSTHRGSSATPYEGRKKIGPIPMPILVLSYIYIYL